MLIAGARGFLCVPTTDSMLDLVIGEATHGEPIQGDLLRSERRNEILLRGFMDQIDDVAGRLRSSKILGKPAPDIGSHMEKLKVAGSSLRFFSQGGAVGLVNTLLEVGGTLAPRRNTRLARARRKLAETRRSRR